MDDPVFKHKYQKYRLRVKLWEKDFKKRNGRIPSKYDIRDASQEIRDSYKMYYKLKTSFLEDTLNDILSDDGFDILEMSQTDGELNVSLNESSNGGPELPLDMSRLMEADDQQENSLGASNGKELSEASLVVVSVNDGRILKNFEPDEELDSNKKAWSEKFSKKTVAIEKKETPRIKPNFNEKLFQNSSFSKRNPRKSLSRSALDSSLRNGQSTLIESLGAAKEALPDLETILLQKAKESPTVTSINSNQTLSGDTKETIKTEVDEGWLNRNDMQNGITTKASVKSAKKVYSSCPNKTTPGRKITYGLSNLDVSKIQRTRDNESKIEDPPITQMVEIEKHQEHKSLAASGVPQVQEVPFEPLERRGAKFTSTMESDSDSVVGDSEDEKEPQEYRHIAKKRKVILSTSPKTGETNATFSTIHNEATNKLPCSKEEKEENKDVNFEEQPPKTKRKKAAPKKKTAQKPKDIPKPKSKAVPKTRASKKKMSKDVPTEQEFEEKPLNPEDLKYALALERGDLTSVPRIKQTELDKADHLAQEYINKLTPINGTGPSTTRSLTPAEEKRAAEKRKLEAKIATGKLNENFVTINIQKKTFVRGKKTVNYSKYKKKLWKNTKRIAALTGPNMDMRGCDGGTLKCFNCGQAGHFAQNCKIKGDALLPLTAQLEEDPSPFPTLEEAEHMASQSALAVHSRNIAKLPQAANAAIYQTDEVEIQNMDVVGDESCNSNYEDSDGGVGGDGDNKESNEMLMETDDELEGFDIDAAAVELETVVSPIKQFVGHKIPETFLKAAGLDNNELSSNSASSKFGGIRPLYDLNTDGSVKEVTSEVLEVLKMFGHTDFRKGQDRAVMRILSGMSTLVTLSTGSGKSLCYQLPAYMYSRQCKAITLVISPLVSLMEDQVTGVPHFLRAHCLHTNQTPQQRVKIMQLIAEGEIDVLLVSPEAVVSGERTTGFGAILRQLPPIAFACIDEAHCVSQWSHNFRPSYLMICKVLKKNLGVNCVLGLTATATLPTRLSIINHLGISDGERGIISDTPLPDNLILSVSKDENKDSALLQLMLSKRFESCQSIIIYCTRRDECERIASFLRTCLQDRKAIEPANVKHKRKRVNWHAEPYHAGMNASRRRTIQNAFMNNELRIVVATIAFGMGINKPDIRAVIHYNMPSNFESYVQEVGRAGRDNKVSHCHLFLDANGGDKGELKRHIYANSLDRHVIRKLLQRIFVSCSCDKNIKDGVQINRNVATDVTHFSDIHGETIGERSNPIARHHLCPGHEIGFSIEKTVEALDIPSENISTLLCYMELDNRWNINVLSNAYIVAKVISYGGPKYLKYAAKECPPLAMAIAMEIKNGTFKETENIIEFSVIDIAAAIGWNSGVVKYQLKNLEWVQINGYPKRSPITVSFHDLGFRIKAPGDFTTEEIDDALDTLYNRSREQEKKQLIQLQYVFQGLSSVAYNHHIPCCSETFSHDRSDQLKAIIRNYFQNDYPKDLKLEDEPSNVADSDIESDVVTLISMYPENNFSGRNVARIFHGISSPNYPAVMWYRCKFWRAQSKIDFNRIVKLANSVIVRWRT